MISVHEETLTLLTDTGEDTRLEDVSIYKDRQRVRSALHDGRDKSYWLLFILCIISATDIIFLLYIAYVFRTSYVDSNMDTTGLQFANPYVGLDRLYKSGVVKPSVIAPILNKPRVAAQVFRDFPEKLAPVGEHDVYGIYGLLSPNERHLQVDHNTHTIVQFRAIDFGMEECSLVVRLPYAEEPLENNAAFALQGTPRLEFCSLDVERPIDVRKLSWRTRPACTNMLGSVVAQPGETFVARFPCEWGSLHVFEVGCASRQETCLVDVWSTQNQTWGVYMYQHQTI